jgi:exopolysaccharide production protein ExoQ
MHLGLEPARYSRSVGQVFLRADCDSSRPIDSSSAPTYERQGDADANRMSKASMHSFELGRARPSTPMIDKCVFVPILACVFATIVSPLLMFATAPASAIGLSPAEVQSLLTTPRLENKIFWPMLAAISVLLAVRNHSRLVGLTWPRHIICLLGYLAFAGASVLWAVRPELSLTKFVVEVMIITSIVLPAMLADRTADMMRGVFLCFAFASILNVFVVLGQTPIIIYTGESIGYPGYFSFKGILGECAAIAFLLSLHEMLYPGYRRVLGAIVVVIATWLMFVSQSKGSLGMAIIAPILAALTLFIARKMRISPATVLLPIPICYEVLSRIISDFTNRISWHLYGNYTFSGRTDIWDFVKYEIGRRPLLGWGYQSFWIGADAPGFIDASGWIKAMPSAHNGYLDTQLDTGYVGLAFFVIFIIATVHAIGRVIDRDPARAWLMLALALFIILTNTLESVWMHGMDILWVMFVIAAAEIGRYWQPFRPGVSEPTHRGPVIAGRRSGLAREWGSNKLARLKNRRT